MTLSYDVNSLLLVARCALDALGGEVVGSLAEGLLADLAVALRLVRQNVAELVGDPFAGAVKVNADGTLAALDEIHNAVVSAEVARAARGGVDHGGVGVHAEKQLSELGTFGK